MIHHSPKLSLSSPSIRTNQPPLSSWKTVTGKHLEDLKPSIALPTLLKKRCSPVWNGMSTRPCGCDITGMTTRLSSICSSQTHTWHLIKRNRSRFTGTVATNATCMMPAPCSVYETACPVPVIQIEHEPVFYRNTIPKSEKGRPLKFSNRFAISCVRVKLRTERTLSEILESWDTRSPEPKTRILSLLKITKADLFGSEAGTSRRIFLLTSQTEKERQFPMRGSPQILNLLKRVTKEQRGKGKHGCSNVFPERHMPHGKQSKRLRLYLNQIILKQG